MGSFRWGKCQVMVHCRCLVAYLLNLSFMFVLCDLLQAETFPNGNLELLEWIRLEVILRKNTAIILLRVIHNNV